MDNASRKFPHGGRGRSLRHGFTLVEMMVATAVLLLIMGILLSMTQQATSVLKNSNGKIESFQAARTAFETMTRNISLATLNSYYDYVNSSGQTIFAYLSSQTPPPTAPFVPAGYQRVSDLHFISGQWNFLNLDNSSGAGPQVEGTHAVFFQAPLGYSANTGYQNLGRLLNACGYFVYYGSDAAPSTLFTAPARVRYQLMEYIQPSENLAVYSPYTASSLSSETSWFSSDVTKFTTSTSVTDIHPIADNVVALVLQPEVSSGDRSIGSQAPYYIAPNYNYNTRDATNPTTLNELPPVMEIVMVAIDEASATRLATNATQLAAFQTTLGGLFTKSSQLPADLAALQTALGNDHLNYRVFQTQVPLRGSKF